ncbi:prenylated Rab acceptor protein 1 [Puma concolor]|uniref:PRA1 family protein n=1 Tax=Puma concolor TaxID=9696 RepID=A0A6P6H534_PUMCO|nr:prenylated Rab acceptor protein 1 [Puma concolor]
MALSPVSASQEKAGLFKDGRDWSNSIPVYRWPGPVHWDLLPETGRAGVVAGRLRDQSALGSFVWTSGASRPRNLGELCQRLVRNVNTGNYVFVGLILYTGGVPPMLLVAWLLFFASSIYSALRSKFVLLAGWSPAHQYALAEAVSFPFFWLAGAGSAVFWRVGATLVVIGSHAAFHQTEAGMRRH